MNILFVASDNNRSSGAFLCMAKLASILQENYKHNVLIVLPRKGTGSAILDELGVKSMLIHSYDWTVKIGERKKIKSKLKNRIKTFLNIGAVYKMSRVIREKQIDFVHINTSWTYVGAKAALKTDIPFVWHIREFLEEDQRREIWNKKKGYSLISKASCVITVSQSLEKKYSKFLPGDRLSYIYEGIDPEPYKFLNHIILEHTRIRLIIVGKVCEKKGQMDAVRACIDLHNSRYPDIILTVVGSDTNQEAEFIKEYVANSNAMEYVNFEGIKEDTAPYYKRADITLMCSSSEAFGRVTVEAMMAGSLLIGAKSAGTCELIRDGETGLLYNSGEVQDLENKISYAIEHPIEMRKIAKQGQAEMLANMTADINAEKIQDLYLRKL